MTYARPDAISNTPPISNKLEKIDSKFEEIEKIKKNEFFFKSLEKVFVDLTECKNSINVGRKSLLEECVIFLITKNNTKRIKKTLPQFSNIPMKVIVLDDSINNDTKRFFEKNVKNTNIDYNGRTEKKEFIQKLDDLKGVGIDYFISDPPTIGWNLGCSRNYAIILAKALGYKKLLMIDDDILINDFNTIAHTFSLLSKFDIVGAKTNGMPDDSIIGHIFRKVGIQQYDFISGQYAALNLDSISYPFPNVYNEDWITFLLESINLKLARYSYVYQFPYDLSINALNKIVFQEKGEIMCEGVIESVVKADINLLQKNNYWSKIIKQRVYNTKKLESTIVKLADNSYNTIFTELWRYHSYINPSTFSSFFRRYFNKIKYWDEFNYLVEELSRG